MSEIANGSLVGAFTGIAVIALMWDEKLTLKNFIKHMVAVTGFGIAIYLAR